MIRFVDVSEALADDDESLKPAFSFFDTVTNKFIEFDGLQVFDSQAELISYYNTAKANHIYKIERFTGLIPNGYFKSFENKKTWREFEELFGGEIKSQPLHNERMGLCGSDPVSEKFLLAKTYPVPSNKDKDK